ncbi:MAG TPA: hypothetical protein VHH34_08550 [Pseudonocardiaceae bacterium]|nr:hypothetical protein [Pseudonocardiaceae bacterium]
MRGHTGRLAATWLRITLALTAVLAVVATGYGVGSAEFTVAVLAAVVVELLTVRALCREWAWQARGAWWRFW